MSTKTTFTFFILILIEGLLEVKSLDNDNLPVNNKVFGIPTTQQQQEQQQQLQQAQELQRQQNNKRTKIRELQGDTADLLKKAMDNMAHHKTIKFNYTPDEQKNIKSKLQEVSKLINSRSRSNNLDQEIDLENKINNAAKHYNDYILYLPNRPPSQPPSRNQQSHASKQASKSNANQQGRTQEPSVQVQRGSPQPSNNKNPNKKPNKPSGK